MELLFSLQVLSPSCDAFPAVPVQVLSQSKASLTARVSATGAEVAQMDFVNPSMRRPPLFRTMPATEPSVVEEDQALSTLILQVRGLLVFLFTRSGWVIVVFGFLYGSIMEVASSRACVGFGRRFWKTRAFLDFHICHRVPANRVLV